MNSKRKPGASARLCCVTSELGVHDPAAVGGPVQMTRASSVNTVCVVVLDVVA